LDNDTVFELRAGNGFQYMMIWFKLYPKQMSYFLEYAEKRGLKIMVGDDRWYAKHPEVIPEFNSHSNTHFMAIPFLRIISLLREIVFKASLRACPAGGKG
jgi:hypothetical protein